MTECGPAGPVRHPTDATVHAGDTRSAGGQVPMRRLVCQFPSPLRKNTGDLLRAGPRPAAPAGRPPSAGRIWAAASVHRSGSRGKDVKEPEGRTGLQATAANYPEPAQKDIAAVA